MTYPSALKKLNEKYAIVKIYTVSQIFENCAEFYLYMPLAAWNILFSHHSKKDNIFLHFLVITWKKKKRINIPRQELKQFPPVDLFNNFPIQFSIDIYVKNIHSIHSANIFIWICGAFNYFCSKSHLNFMMNYRYNMSNGSQSV